MGKPLWIAGITGIAGILLLLMSVVVVLLDQNSENLISILPDAGNFNIISIFGLITHIVSLGFLYGFIVLGKRFNNKMLVVTGWLYVLFTVISFVIYLLFAIGVGDIFSPPEIETEYFQDIFDIFNKLPLFLLVFNIFGEWVLWPFIIISTLAIFSLQITFSMGLFKLKNNGVPLAKWCGWGELIRAGTNIISPFVIILEIIMFFKASKQFEQEDSENLYKTS